MDYPRNDALVSTEWLGAHLGEAGLKVIDGSWYLPAEKRDPKAEYAAGHIPGAVYFDIDTIADTSSPLPHMFPSPKVFAAAVGELGIGNADRIVVYDGGSMTAAGRVWWMFHAFGHDDVAILDGGAGKWRAEDRPWTAAASEVSPARFETLYRSALVRSLADVLDTIDSKREQILDARSAGRFQGTAPEPRQGLRGGHMPGARNLPYTELLAADGTMRPAAELKALFENSGVDLKRPVIASCGSGVSATVLLLGLHLIGHDGGTLYDGSWSEWGSRQDTPVVT